VSTLRIMTIDDVQNDEDLKQYYAYNRKLVTFLAREFANTAAELSAMLKAHDERAPGGKKRRGKVVRPMALAAGVLILVSKYITLSSRRFATEYQQEIEANRRRPTRGRRNFTFGG
jgi:hypothetical protein